MINYNKQQGFTLVEVVLAMAVGSIVLAGSYAAYSLVHKQYVRLADISEVQDVGLPTLNFISRDLRSTGRVALDASAESTYGEIATPITITDSGNACCDQLQITYDVDLNTRYRKTYFVQNRTTGTTVRSAMYLDVEQWNSGTSAWDNITNDALLADYVEDFQVVGSDVTGGFPALVDVSLVFRSKNTWLEAINYTKPSYEYGNYALTASDSFYRDEFSATINLRNLR